MYTNPGEAFLAALQNSGPINIATRIDRNGKTTYHVLTSDRRNGVCYERIYDQDHQLIRLQKRAPFGRSETYFDAKTGSVSRLFEASTLPDGNSMTKDIIYEGQFSKEAVVVVSPHGELVRRVEREYAGLRTIFQGQTDYNPDGSPLNTVNHYLHPSSGKLMQREQIRWRDEDQRSMTETFYFDEEGSLTKYSKVVYHADSGPFLEVIQTYNCFDQSLVKREICAYNHSGQRTCIDTLVYGEDGEICRRQSLFYDRNGKEIAAQNLYR